MKLRIRGNSLRFRLTKSEVKRLAEEGICSESTNFGPSEIAFRYSLKSDSSQASAQATFSGGEVTVALSPDQVQQWAGSEKVGMDFRQTISEADGPSLRILIEKDFQCLAPGDREPEDDADTYPHPHADSQSC